MANRYWVGNSGNWNDTAHWSASSGGAGGVSVPSTSDDVFFDANSFTLSGQTVTINVNPGCHVMDWTGVLNIPTLAGSDSFVITPYGDVTLVTGMNLTFLGTWDFTGPAGQNITTAGHDLLGGIQIQATGTCTLLDDLLTSNVLYIYQSFDANGFAVTCGGLFIENNDTYTVSLGGGTWTVDGRLYSSVNSGININALPGLTLNIEGSPIIFIEGDTDNILGFINGITLGDLTIDYQGTGFVRIEGGPTMGTLTVLNGSDHYLYFESSTTTTVGDFVASGTAGHLLNFASSTPGSAATISKSSGTVSVSYISIQDSTAAGGATFLAFHSTDLGNNLVWVFTRTITASAGAGGSISPSGAVAVSLGDDQAFTIVPNSTFEVLDVLVDGLSVGAVLTYIFTNVVVDHTISVTFAHAIVASSGANGSISPPGTTLVTDGESQAYVITPDDGYEVADVFIDGVLIGPVGSYTFSNVTTEHTISATFILVPPTIDDGTCVCGPSSTLSLSSIVTSLDAHYGDASRGAFTKAKILEYVNSEVRLLRVFFDLPTSEYIFQMPVWNDVFNYALPCGYKGFISFMSNFFIGDQTDFFFTNTKAFWSDVTGRNIVSEQRQGICRSLLVRLLSPTLANFSLNNMESFDGNGTWHAFGDASNVHTNNQYFHGGTGSVSFDLTYATGIGGIYTTDMQAVDLSGTNIQNIGTAFLWMLLPSFTGFTSVDFRWGSSSSDYYQQTATVQAGGEEFTPGWQQLKYAWSSASTFGNPNSASITYLRVAFHFPSTMPVQRSICIDDIWMRQQILMNLTYSSEYLVRDTSGNLFEEFANFNTSQDWTLNLDTEFKDWIVFRVLERAFTFVKPVVLSLQEIKDNLRNIKQELETAYPSRRQLAVDNYYETVIENPVPDTSSVYQPGLTGGGFNPNDWGC